MKPLQANSYTESTDTFTYICIITKCISEHFRGPKCGHNREADGCMWAGCPFRFLVPTYSLIRQVCFKNITVLISETVHSLGLLSILAHPHSLSTHQMPTYSSWAPSCLCPCPHPHLSQEPPNTVPHVDKFLSLNCCPVWHWIRVWIMQIWTCQGPTELEHNRASSLTPLLSR